VAVSVWRRNLALRARRKPPRNQIDRYQGGGGKQKSRYDQVRSLGGKGPGKVSCKDRYPEKQSGASVGRAKRPNKERKSGISTRGGQENAHPDEVKEAGIGKENRVERLGSPLYKTSYEGIEQHLGENADGFLYRRRKGRPTG